MLFLLWRQLFQRIVFLILKRQASPFHYGSKFPPVTITVFTTILIYHSSDAVLEYAAFASDKLSITFWEGANERDKHNERQIKKKVNTVYLLERQIMEATNAVYTRERQIEDQRQYIAFVSSLSASQEGILCLSLPLCVLHKIIMHLSFYQCSFCF
jgi:hypothetical protein